MLVRWSAGMTMDWSIRWQSFLPSAFRRAFPWKKYKLFKIYAVTADAKSLVFNVYHKRLPPYLVNFFGIFFLGGLKVLVNIRFSVGVCRNQCLPTIAFVEKRENFAECSVTKPAVALLMPIQFHHYQVGYLLIWYWLRPLSFGLAFSNSYLWRSLVCWVVVFENETGFQHRCSIDF